MHFAFCSAKAKCTKKSQDALKFIIILGSTSLLEPTICSEFQLIMFVTPISFSFRLIGIQVS